MLRNSIEPLQVDLFEVEELDLKGTGWVSIKGNNSRLRIGFHHTDLLYLQITIEDPNLSEMSVSSVVEGFTDDEILIRIRKPREGFQDVPDDKEIVPTRPLRIDLRENKELSFKNSGTVLVIGENTRLFLGFRDGDFVFVKLSIMNIDLNRIRISDVFDNSIFASIIDQRD